MMKRILCAVALLSIFAVAAQAGEGKPVPHRVISMDQFSAFINNWDDESMPRYVIINNQGEWKANFSAAATMGNQKPFEPNPEIFQQSQLVAIARVSEAPAAGQSVLAVRSVELVGDEVVINYSFAPPPPRGAHKVKNTLLLALPKQYDWIRFIEDEETPESRRAAMELEAAKAAGLVKQPTPGTPGR